jgi:hypothetical protein
LHKQRAERAGFILSWAKYTVYYTVYLEGMKRRIAIEWFACHCHEAHSDDRSVFCHAQPDPQGVLQIIYQTRHIESYLYSILQLVIHINTRRILSGLMIPVITEKHEARNI